MGAGGGGARRGGPAGRDKKNTPGEGSYRGVLIMVGLLLLAFVLFVLLG